MLFIISLQNTSNAFVCGKNIYQSLITEEEDIQLFRRIPAILSPVQNPSITKVVQNDFGTLVLTQDGKAYAFGSNQFGILGQYQLQNTTEMNRLVFFEN